ncbi:proton-translocating transhydrogenase family protein [Curtobacterium sp. PhB115]|uniref:proton-translocating transhydrogenase family protein n=1 Tax=Curtobacterium sp. PhB115 TaxID=2485173 RepID=UPI000F4C815C|nr:proton-translocating transhydrogenase family protein [Curtobacterium sp. PhB115]ROP58659.1 NAD(P) transhydrogenase subunit alpha [Curtobacterium sp. PhB115]
MSETLLNNAMVFILAVLVGFEVIGKVPATLHTPMMSGANAVHGVVIVGAIVVVPTADSLTEVLLIGLAAAFAAANVVGGYIVTDRMLEMFRPVPRPAVSTTPAR